jgi:hypothetical protein
MGNHGTPVALVQGKCSSIELLRRAVPTSVFAEIGFDVQVIDVYRFSLSVIPGVEFKMIVL